MKRGDYVLNPKVEKVVHVIKLSKCKNLFYQHDCVCVCGRGCARGGLKHKGNGFHRYDSLVPTFWFMLRKSDGGMYTGRVWLIAMMLAYD